MRNIINMIIKIAIIWGAAWLFPEYVKVQDTRTMVSKHAFGTAYSYCLQYPEWREELGSRTSTVKSPQITGMPGAHNGSDATADLAERRVELREKMEKVEDTVREAVGDNKSLYEYLLEYVTTEGATFHWMKQKGIPCERTYFYEVRRYFYYLMAKRI